MILFGASPAHAANQTYIASIDIDCVIDKTGRATFTETWDMDAYEGTEVYKVFKNMGDKTLTLVSVEENGTGFELLKKWKTDKSRKYKKNKCGLLSTDEGYELCFGIGEYGHHTYTMTYTIDKFVNQYKDNQGINYAFLSNMDIDVEQVDVDVSSKLGKFLEVNSDMWAFGYSGRYTYTESGHVHLYTEQGNAYKVQLLMGLPTTTSYANPSTTHEDETFNEVVDDALYSSSYGKVEDGTSDLTAVLDAQGTLNITQTLTLTAQNETVYRLRQKTYNDEAVTLTSITKDGYKINVLDEWLDSSSYYTKRVNAGVAVIGSFGQSVNFPVDEGTHTYVLNYSVAHVLRKTADGKTVLEWPFLYAGNDDISSFTLDLSGESETFTSEMTCSSYGAYTDPVWINGHLTYSCPEEDDHDQEVAVLIPLSGTYTDVSDTYKTYAEMEEDFISHGRWYDTRLYKEWKAKQNKAFLKAFGMIIGAIVSLVVAIFALVAGYIAKSRKPVFADGIGFKPKNVHPFRDIPVDDLIYANYLAKKSGIKSAKDENIMTAFVMKWLRDGQVKMEQGPDKGKIFKRHTWNIGFTRPLETNNALEGSLYQLFVKAAGGNRILEDKEFEEYARKHDIKIINWLKRTDSSVEKELKARKWMKAKKEKRRFLIFPYKTHVYDAGVREDMEHVYGLYLFLKDEDNMAEKEAVEVKVWDEYLIYATIFGIADKVSKQMNIIKPDLTDGDGYHSGFSYTDYYIAHSIAHDITHNGVSNARVSYNSSSSGGGGGGGFSSGGGGGGGFSGGGGGGVR